MGKWAKIILGIVGGILFIFIGLLVYGYYKYFGRYSADEQRYPHNVEYIDPQASLYSQGFEACDEDRIAQYYNPERATYVKGKNGLRKFILSNYENRGYSDSGYLNIRFVINCKGETGRYVIHENDLDLEPTKLDSNMVSQLFRLTRQLDKWNPVFFRERTWDSYMYISYRIENGQIIEILP